MALTMRRKSGAMCIMPGDSWPILAARPSSQYFNHLLKGMNFELTAQFTLRHQQI